LPIESLPEQDIAKSTISTPFAFFILFMLAALVFAFRKVIMQKFGKYGRKYRVSKDGRSHYAFINTVDKTH